MCKDSSIAAGYLSVATKTTITCNTCLLSDISEAKTLYIELPVHKSVQFALLKYLETTEGEDFCACCREITPNLRDQSLTETNTFLIVQQKRFCNNFGITGKNCTLVECFPQKLLVPVGKEDDFKTNVSYELIGMINHEGSLSAGHYWSFVKDSSGKWYNCNDRAVMPLPDVKKKLNNIFSYILFYKKSS